MNMQEKATLREVFTEITDLRDRMDDRFDEVFTRLRGVESELAANRAVMADRKEHRVEMRWKVSSLVALIGASATAAGVVTTIVLRFFGA